MLLIQMKFQIWREKEIFIEIIFVINIFLSSALYIMGKSLYFFNELASREKKMVYLNRVLLIEIIIARLNSSH